MQIKSFKPVSENVERLLIVGNDLIIIFKGGGIYKYINKFPDIVKTYLDFDNMVKAESVGKYVNANIRKVYQSVKMNKEELDVVLNNNEILEVESGRKDG